MKIFAFGFCATLLAANAAQAEDSCALKQLASLPVTIAADGDMTIPVTVGSTEHRFLLGLNEPSSAILGSFADENGLTTKKLTERIRPTVNNQAITQIVKVPDFAVGSMHGTNFQMFRYEKDVSGSPDVAGLLGLDFFINLDVELDLHDKKLNLFSQDHCKGKVVYWAKEAAAVPFDSDLSGHFDVMMNLDGKPVAVDFSAAQGHAYMGADAAKRIFGLDAQSPGMQSLPQPLGAPTVYHYPFKALSIQGISIANPDIHIDARVGDCRAVTKWQGLRPFKCYGMADLRLRATEMNELRLYIAFKEKMLYVTAADAHL